MSERNPYRAAGTFGGDGYIEREADRLLVRAIRRNKRFPYMLAPRQSGKSSLIRHTMEILDPETYRSVLIDLSVFPPQAFQDYDAFLDEFFSVCLKGLGSARPALTSGTFLDRLKGLLDHGTWRLVLFLDEVDVLRRATFKDTVFSTIRNVFNESGAGGSELVRVQFVLAGAAKPAELISDPYRSPFNVGEAVELSDFTSAEVERLSDRLREAGPPVAPDVHDALYRHAGGSVYLSQLILEELWEEAVLRPQAAVTVGCVEAVVDRIVESAARDLHFTNIYSQFQRDARAVDVLLRVLRGQPVNDADREVLLHAGLGGKERPFRNRIYERVFGTGGPLDVVPQSGTFRLPVPRNPYFVGRKELLASLRFRFHPPGQDPATRAAVISLTGMGGIGKSALAVEYAWVNKELYQDVLWVQAAGALSLGFQKAALQLGLIGDPAQPQQADRDAGRAIRELNESVPRLLILDDVVDENSVRNWLPTSGGCRVLITSRFAGWSSAVENLSVAALDAPEARALLARRGGVPDEPALEDVARQLGGLPLALELAAGTLRQGNFDFDSYIKLYASAPRDVIDQSAGPARFPFAIVQTSVIACSLLAQAALRLASFYEGDPIPLVALDEGAELLQAGMDQLMGNIKRLKELNWLSRILGGQSAARAAPRPTPADIRGAVRELADRSLIVLERETFSLHPLVRAVQVEALDEVGKGEWRARTALLPGSQGPTASRRSRR